MDSLPKCALCGVRACSEERGSKSPPPFCPVPSQTDLLEGVSQAYREDEEIRRLAVAAAQVEAEGYCVWPRLQEVMAFARRLGVSRLGIACCIGLLREARILHEILEANGFEVASVCCKAGSIPKEEIGLAEEEKIQPGQFEALCNPVGQAELLNAAKTGLNIVVGLCVGHDSLFFRHSQAPVTVLVAKDRATGHNPAAAIYTSHSYYKRFKEGE